MLSFIADLLCLARFTSTKRNPAQDAYAKGICPALVDKANTEGFPCSSFDSKTPPRTTKITFQRDDLFS
jgi:hypothetical protein